MAGKSRKVVSGRQPGLVVLIDNEAGDSGLEAQWGLGIAIRTFSGGLWLLDGGANGSCLANAVSLGISPHDLHAAILSHGHYDHADGLTGFLDVRPDLPVHGHPDVFTPRYACPSDGTPRYIGVSDRFRRLARDVFRSDQGLVQLDQGLWMLSDIPRRPGHAQAVAGFFLDPEGTRSDSVPDDALLVLETPRGPIVILGCCHSGLANSLAMVREALGLKDLFALVGGLHLHDADPAAMEEAVATLRSFSVQRIYPGHCTGMGAIASLSAAFPDRVRPLRSGMEIDFSAPD